MKNAWLLLCCALILLVLGCQSAQPAQATQLPGSMNPQDSISGMVVDEEEKPIAGAAIRLKAADNFVLTDEEGQFVLSGLPNKKPCLLTAWAKGYYNGGGQSEYTVGTADAKIVLKKHTVEDHPDYGWVSAFARDGNSVNCENCHADPDHPDAALPFTEWRADAHALSTQNPRFLTMYLGRDVAGNQSPVRAYGQSRDYGRIPLAPDLTQPYFGPGYKLDFPGTPGNCAACHAPAAAIDAAYGTDPTQVSGAGAEGSACDFCHKVWDVHLDSSSGRPFSNMPGVLSFEFRRPGEGHQFFAGPFGDVTPGEDTYSPIQKQSQFCAACHFGSFWDTQVYNSFGEWLESPYSRAGTGKTCQDCHMPAGKSSIIARTDKGGISRNPRTVFSHRMPGAADKELLQNAISLTANVRQEAGSIVVDVSLTNDATGHDIPTDSPLRQMLLLVKVTDPEGRTLPLQTGPTIPQWGGVGDPAQGYYAGLPGVEYAKILSELWTEITPTGAYWNPTRIVSDNRIPAFKTDASQFKFAAPADGRARVDITLLFRRAFKDLMDQKGWDVPDILMKQQTLTIGG